MMDKYSPEGPFLEIGSGDQSLKDIIPHDYYVGLDIPPVKATVRADAHKLPFRDESFPTVISVETFEHLRNPFEVFREVARILKKNGCFILSTVWKWPIHNHPVDYWRYTPDCVSAFLRENNIKCLVLESYEEGHVFSFGLKND